MGASVLGGVLGAAGNIAGGIAGQEAGRGDRGEARNQQVIANHIIQELAQAPEVSKPLILEKYKQAGVLTPQMEQIISAGPSATSQIGTDQQSLDAQKDALRKLQERSEGGLSAGDRGALAEAQMKAGADTESKRQQILQQAQAQMGGAGQTGRTLAAQLAAAQSGANQQHSNANQVAQMAAQNALQATAATGNLGGQVNQQQFNQASQRAQAADEMNRFNVQNQIGQQQRNVAGANNAQAANLGNLQSIDNANVGNQNQELNNQLNRQMQQWQANTNLASMKSNSAAGLGSSLQKTGDQNAKGAYEQYAGAGQALGGVAKLFYDGGQVQDYRNGGVVQGKEVVPGDHPINDNVPAMLSAKEIVVPKSLADSKLGKQLVKLINAHNEVKNKLNQED